MKQPIVLTFLTLVMISITAFEFTRSETESKEEFGNELISVLRRSSEKEFSELFPSLSDFHQLMIRNSELYGKNLQEAAAEFGKQYNLELAPAFADTYAMLLKEGSRIGVDWQNAKFVSADTPAKVESDFTVVPMTVTFTSGGYEHHLKIEKTLLIDGKWRISQYITLD